MTRFGLVTLVFAGFSNAWAQDCPAPYTVDALVADLTATEAALRDSNDAGATEAGARLGAGLPCLDELLPALIAARSYRAVGAGLQVSGNIDEAKKWFTTSLEVDPTWSYGLQDLAEGHPLRNQFEDMKETAAVEPTPVEGKIFAEGKHYLNGRKISRPQARGDRYHIFQVDGTTFTTQRILGNAFPDEVLANAPVEQTATTSGKKPKGPKPPKTKKPKGPKGAKDPKAPKAPKESESEEPKIGKNGCPKGKKRYDLPDGSFKCNDKRKRPPEKTPLLIAGGALIVTSGVLAYLANDVKSRMREITNLRTGALGPSNAGYMIPGMQTQMWNAPLSFTDEGVPVELSIDYLDSLALQESRLVTYCGGMASDDCANERPRERLEAMKRRNSQLAYAAIGVLGVGVGVTTWGVLVDGDLVMPRVRVKF